MSDELHPPEIITTIYLLRHGHTEPTENNKIYNDPQVALTERGVKQAHHQGVWLKSIKPTHLLSSTAVRVVSTAKIISQEIGLEAVTINDLNEWDVGTWEGRTYIDLKKNNPEEYQAWCADPIENAPPEGESIVDMFNRIKIRLKDITKSYEGSSIALVTHAGVIRSILMEALGIPVRNFWRLSVPAGSVSRVDFSENFATVYFMSLDPSTKEST